MIAQVSNAILNIILATLILTGRIEIWHIYVTGFLAGTVQAFQMPARQVLVSDLVGKQYLFNAISLNSAASNVSRIVGPAICGLLIEAFGVDISYYVQAAMYVVATVWTIQITVPETHTYQGMAASLPANPFLPASKRVFGTLWITRSFFHMIRAAGQRGVRFSKAISYGNACDVDECDLLEYFITDDETRMVAAYIEGVRDGQRFRRVLRKLSAIKPVIVLKGGYTSGGAVAASSHTGSLAGADESWEGLAESDGCRPRLQSRGDGRHAGDVFLAGPAAGQKGSCSAAAMAASACSPPTTSSTPGLICLNWRRGNSSRYTTKWPILQYRRRHDLAESL